MSKGWKKNRRGAPRHHGGRGNGASSGCRVLGVHGAGRMENEQKG